MLYHTCVNFKGFDGVDTDKNGMIDRGVINHMCDSFSCDNIYFLSYNKHMCLSERLMSVFQLRFNFSYFHFGSVHAPR
jgi:hypothetical protein